MCQVKKIVSDYMGLDCSWAAFALSSLHLKTVDRKRADIKDFGGNALKVLNSLHGCLLTLDNWEPLPFYVAITKQD